MAERRVVQAEWARGSRARRAAPCRAGPVRAGAGGRRAGKRAFIPPLLPTSLLHRMCYHAPLNWVRNTEGHDDERD